MRSFNLTYSKENLYRENKENIKENDLNIIKNEKNEQKQENLKETNENIVYLKNWWKTRNATIFRLSSKLVQFIFLDKTELIFIPNKKFVIYVDNHSNKFTFDLMEAVNNNENIDFVKRLKYSINFLNHVFRLKDYSVSTNLSTNSSNKNIA